MNLPVQHRPILLALALAALCSAALFVRQAEGRPAPSPLPDEALSQAMHQMEQALEALGKGVKADNRDAQLAELAKFQSAVMTAKEKTPESAEKVEEKKRAAFVADYRKTLVEALQFSCAAETAILDGKFKEADTLVRNKLGGLKSTGHGKFKQDRGGK
ncbi:MAG: hypothetical protein IPK67_07600 [Planctomycetes bacterium]|nr:hypothetical protein [Planctomycetota bacterium]